MRCIAMAGAMFAACAAQEAPGVYDAGNGVKAPVVIHKTEPEFSEEARQAGVDGQVAISLVVDVDGKPRDLKCVPTIGFGLDEKALAAVRAWRFAPGTKDGVPAAVQTSVVVNFTASDKKDTLHLRSFACNLPEGATRPAVLNVQRPAPPHPERSFTATLAFEVDEQGAPQNLHVVSVSDAGWERDVVAALREWRFQPSAADGRPVVAPCKLSFAMGREPAAATVSRIGPGVSPPRIISKTEPEYAEEARQARYQGTVVLQAVVDSTGLPRDLKVIRPLGLGLDEKAIEAVSQWRFQPGMKDGDAVAVLVTVEVNFRLFGNDRKWHLISINFGTPSGASRPRLVNAKFPETSDAPDSSVNVAFDIDDQGKPVNIKVDKLSSEKLEREILAAIRDWRFVPSAKDGKAVLVPAHVLLGR